MMKKDNQTEAICYAHELAESIARKIYYHIHDNRLKEELADLLKKFADEIQRSAIEP